MNASYKRVRALFTDHLGLPRGKYIPAGLVQEGARFCIATYALTFDRTMTPEAEAGKLMEGLPDLDLEFDFGDIRRSWQPDTGIVIGDLHFHGNPFLVDARHVLKKAISDWKALGYEPSVGIEFEAFVLQPDGNGGWEEWDTPGAYVYGTGPAVDPIGLFTEIMDTAEEIGLPVESINSEYDTPQFELTMRYADALKAVDEAVMFKLMAREIAMKHGLRLTFMGKPFNDRGGSGLHVNFSLKDNEGNNVFKTLF
ncbi:MAG: glutamine synthetase, partial [Chloroflexota bacterium]